MTAPFIYDRIGAGYTRHRRADPRIARRIEEALGDAASIVNVGAGAGSYEPAGRRVVAVEPSLEMIGQRTSPAPVVRGVAEALPFPDRTFDAALAVLTMHHWTGWHRGISELRRVASSRIVTLTWDCDAGSSFWLLEYFPRILEHDRERMPPIADLCEALGAASQPVPIPRDCLDGFLASGWAKPEIYLDPDVRGGMSAFDLLEDSELRTGLSRLSADLTSGAWRRRWGDLTEQDDLDCGYRLVTADLVRTR